MKRKTIVVLFVFLMLFSFVMCSCSQLGTSYEPQYGKIRLAVFIDEQDGGTKENFEALLAKRIAEYEEDGESEMKIQIYLRDGAEKRLTEKYFERMDMNVSSYRVCEKEDFGETIKYIELTVPLEDVKPEILEKLSSFADVTEIHIKASVKIYPC